jgi:diacylglycerol O-acyltransferase
MIGPERAWVVARTTLDEVKLVRRAFGATVNDVVLAVVARGFRDLIEARGEDPDGVVLRSLVPVSVRAPGTADVLDNRVSAILYELPTGVADPVERLHATQEAMARLKGSHEADAGATLTAALGSLPHPLVAGAVRAAAVLNRVAPQRMVNTVVTNVPGPQFPLYAAGRQMVDYLPFVPLSSGVRIGVAIVSYNGLLRFGVTGDATTAPDVDVLAAGIEAGVAELIDAAGALAAAA